MSETAKKSTRLDGDNRTIVKAVTILVALLAGVSFAAGVPGLVGAGGWAGLPRVLAWLVPLIVDGGLVVFALVAVVRRARRESAAFAWACLTLLTACSAAVQMAHAMTSHAAVTVTAVAGAAVAAAFPLVVFAATHSLLDLAIAPAPKRGRGAGRGKAAGRSAKSGTAKPARKPATEAKRQPAVASAVKPQLAAVAAEPSGSRDDFEERVAAAVAAVSSGEMSQRGAAERFSVSRGALQSRLKGAAA